MSETTVIENLNLDTNPVGGVFWDMEEDISYQLMRVGTIGNDRYYADDTGNYTLVVTGANLHGFGRCHTWSFDPDTYSDQPTAQEVVDHLAEAAEDFKFIPFEVD